MKKLIISFLALTLPLFIYGQNITFKDEEVKLICVTIWDTNGDGELSVDEAASVNDISSYFKNRTIKAKEEIGWVAKKTLEDMCRDAWNFVLKNN